MYRIPYGIRSGYRTVSVFNPHTVPVPCAGTVVPYRISGVLVRSQGAGKRSAKDKQVRISSAPVQRISGSEYPLLLARSGTSAKVIPTRGPSAGVCVYTCHIQTPLESPCTIPLESPEN